MKKSVILMGLMIHSISNVLGQVAVRVDRQSSGHVANQHPMLKNDLSHLPDLSVSQERELRLIFKERAMEEARIRGESMKLVSSMDEGQSSESDTSSFTVLSLKEELHQNALRYDERVSAVLTAAQMVIYRERGQRWELE